MKFSLSSIFYLFLMTVPLHAESFLSKADFYQFVMVQRGQLGKRGLSQEEFQKRNTPLAKSEAFLNQFPDGSPKCDVVLIDDHIFYSEVYDLFQGDAKKAVTTYVNATTGKLSSSLFILSGAGEHEEISQLSKSRRSVELTLNRVYSSGLAFNTSYRIRLTRYKISKGFYAVVNEVIQDFSRQYEKEGKKWHGKSYHKVEQDMNIDFYKQIDSKQFKFVSLNFFEGDIKSRSKALNTTKTIGNLLTFNLLDNKLHQKMKEEAQKTWERRKGVFQKLILNSR